MIKYTNQLIFSVLSGQPRLFENLSFRKFHHFRRGNVCVRLTYFSKVKALELQINSFLSEHFYKELQVGCLKSPFVK